MGACLNNHKLKQEKYTVKQECHDIKQPQVQQIMSNQTRENLLLVEQNDRLIQQIQSLMNSDQDPQREIKGSPLSEYQQRELKIANKYLCQIKRKKEHKYDLSSQATINYIKGMVEEFEKKSILHSKQLNKQGSYDQNFKLSLQSPLQTTKHCTQLNEFVCDCIK